MLCWIVLDHRAQTEQAGLIPTFIRDSDPRPLAEQIDERYRHGGGWSPMPEWSLDHASLVLQYPGDPPMRPLFTTTVRDEQFVIYEHGICMIRKGNEFEVARLD